MVTVQFNFKTIIEAQEFLGGLTTTVSGPARLPVKLAPDMPSKDSIPIAGGPIYFDQKPDFSVPISEQPAPEKKKRGPKPKAELVKEYGIEDCRNALRNLFDVKGREVAKSVLTEFKVDRVTYLKPEQFAAFIERCKTASQPE